MTNTRNKKEKVYVRCNKIRNGKSYNIQNQIREIRQNIRSAY